MTNVVLWIYDWMARHRRLRFASLVAVTAMLLALVSRVHFKEDISDFLPLDAQQQQELRLWQDVSGANRIYAVFESSDTAAADPDALTEAVARFVDAVNELDTAHWIQNLTAQADLSAAEQTVQFVYRNIPYFLDDDDYTRIDSLLHTDGYVASQLQADRDQLMTPMGGMASMSIAHDPLNLFSPVFSTLQQFSQTEAFTFYDGYILTPDMRRAVVMMDSSFGPSETDSNARLLDLLTAAADSSLFTLHPSLFIPHFTGGPVIAVGNARQIKTDSLLSVAIAATLILALLYYAFRRKTCLLLIAASIAWGWLFALACLSLLHSEVSIIVIGISSVIVGIAVNYPLHLLAHLQHTPHVRQALSEISKPLVVGNITTVGAFLALLPLQSTALRDLGLFSASLLIGTILFVLLWLPHFVTSDAVQQPAPQSHDLLSRMARVSLHDKRWLVAVMTILTLFFGYHSFGTSFDTDLTHINYISDSQRSDMSLLNDSSRFTLHASLLNDPHFLLHDGIQRDRLSRWQHFADRSRDKILASLQAEQGRLGFADDSFLEFRDILEADYRPQPLTFFKPLPPQLLMQNIDVKAINNTMLAHLSDNFNYIGWACACIVFLFLWFSFRSLVLAVLSFLPMAVSWLWILGIMSLCGLQFNIVNIILATFIFGQGDDYTIFMTEGAVYEARHRRRMLASYKRAIILSALIMFIGIGSLIVARHPALHSLAEVTIVGMFSVVLMAFVIPPLALRLWIRFCHKQFV